MTGLAADLYAGIHDAVPSRTLATRRLSAVEPQRVDWLWRSRIPRGKLALLVGDPGAGKSFASLAIAAAVTSGAPLPGGEPGAPASVLVWNGEDGTADTIRPRAEAAGADLDRMYVIDGEINGEGSHSPFGLQSIELLADHAAQLGDVALVIVDPIAALLAGVDAHRDSEIRSSLQPLADFAESTGVAVAVVAHLNKRDAEKALYRVGGSIGFVGLARSVLLVAADPESGQRAIAPLKNNLCAPPDPVEFRIDEEGRFWWGQPSKALTAERLLRSVRPDAYGGARHTAKTFVREVLAAGPLAARDLESFGVDRGISDIALRRARKSLGVVSRKTREGWLLHLPTE